MILILTNGKLRKIDFENTTEGTEVAVSLKRGAHLQDGDILKWNESNHRAIVVAIQFKEVMVVQLSEVMKQQTDKLGKLVGIGSCFR